MRYELKRIQIVSADTYSMFHDKVGDVYWAIKDNEDEDGNDAQPYGILTESIDALLVKETIDKANSQKKEYESILTFGCPFNIEWEFKSITQCSEV